MSARWPDSFGSHPDNPPRPRWSRGSWLLALPPYHVAGLQVLVRSALAGTTPVAIPPSFDVAELPAAIAALGTGRRYASLVAVQLGNALADAGAAAALAELDAVLIGGVEVRIDDGRVVLGGETVGQGLPQSGAPRSVRRTRLVSPPTTWRPG